MSEQPVDYQTGEITVNLEILRKAFPQEAIKRRKGGEGKMLSYVEGHTVIHRLIEATGNRYDVAVRGIEWREGLGKNGDQSLCMATVALTIPGLGTREAIGVQMVSPKGGEDLVKGAVTDGLKKAATLFGVGLELYGDFYEEEIAAREEEQRQTRQSNRITADEVDAMDALGVAVYGDEWTSKREALVNTITRGFTDDHTLLDPSEYTRIMNGLKQRATPVNGKEVAA